MRKKYSNEEDAIFRRKRIRLGIYHKYMRGDFPAKAPFGYINKMDGKRRFIEIDNNEAEVVRTAFFEIAFKNVKPKDIYKKYSDMLSNKTFYKMLSNRFYIGWIWNPYISAYTKGNHQAIISEEVFYLTQERIKAVRK